MFFFLFLISNKIMVAFLSFLTNLSFAFTYILFHCYLQQMPCIVADALTQSGAPSRVLAGSFSHASTYITGQNLLATLKQTHKKNKENVMLLHVEKLVYW